MERAIEIAVEHLKKACDQMNLACEAIVKCDTYDENRETLRQDLRMTTTQVATIRTLLEAMVIEEYDLNDGTPNLPHRVEAVMEGLLMKEAVA